MMFIVVWVGTQFRIVVYFGREAGYPSSHQAGLTNTKGPAPFMRLCCVSVASVLQSEGYFRINLLGLCGCFYAYIDALAMR